MVIQIPTYSERLLSEFAENEWKKNLAFLQKQFGLSEDDCKDVFQEAFIILYRNIVAGLLKDITSSLSTYFTGICINKAHELLRYNNKQPRSETRFRNMDNIKIKEDKIEEILQLEDDVASFTERKEALVRQIVRRLPSPCKELLWGFFRDNLNMKTLAQMYDYSSEDSVKVTKHRCQNKFKKRFNELRYLLLNE